ncbi:MAG: DUF2461 domain-containing protein [Anaerolineae bacterium]|nr:DUF2461 domain-containing protein [Anaerolineae bacterium]
MHDVPPFEGFSQETFAYLRDLRDNNDKDWFDANKERYIEHVRTPAVSLVATVGMQLQDHFPDVHYDTRTNGSGSLMRINRDVRFSEDKSPYKSNIAMMWWEGAGKKMQSPGFGLQITPDDAGLMAGMFGFDKAMLTQYREAVVDDERGMSLVQAVTAVQSAGEYTLNGEHYKKPPRGYPVLEDEREPYMRYNALWVSAMEIPPSAVMEPSFADYCVEHFVKMAPIQQWLAALRV